MSVNRDRRHRGLIWASFVAAIVLVVVSLALPAAAAPRGARLWKARYAGSGDGLDQAVGVVADPDGSKVFVTGLSPQANGSLDYVTIAYEASTGARVWMSRYGGPGGYNRASALAVSPDGSEVFVTGSSEGTGGRFGFATVAYDASTGAKLWVSRYTRSGLRSSAPTAIAVSPTGGAVYVTGWSVGAAPHTDYATIAYSPQDGYRLWASRYNGPAKLDDVPFSIAASPDGSTVFVTGWSQESSLFQDYATVAYDASTGAQIWVARYNGPGNGADAANAVRTSPDGTMVFVTGSSQGRLGAAWETIAYDAADGTPVWAKRTTGSGARAMVVSPDGSKVIVTGDEPGTGGYDAKTVAYDASTGQRLWSRSYNGPAGGVDSAFAVTTSPDGSKVFITGNSTGTSGGREYITLAYDASSGATIWRARYAGHTSADDAAFSIAASPDGSRVFVTGMSDQILNSGDYATLAYAS